MNTGVEQQSLLLYITHAYQYSLSDQIDLIQIFMRAYLK